MRLAVPTLFCVAGLVLQSVDADAETWTVVRGSLIKERVTRTLSGSFTGSISSSNAEDEPDLLAIDDFSLAAGRQQLVPEPPIEYEGLAPTGWVSAADQIGIEGEQVTSVHLRTGGKQVGGGLGYVTFRFLDLRADASHGGVVQGHLPDSDAPRRLVLKGDVYQVEQRFQLPPACPPVSPPLSGGGGSGSGGSVDLIAYSTSYAAVPNSVAPAPTLEQLGIRAPDGAEISFEAGALRVSSSGDLFVEGTISEVELPGLTSVSLTTPARIIVTGRIVVPGGSVTLNGGEVHAGSGSIDLGNPSIEPPACQRLTPILPASERVVGRFWLVASAARQIQIDVMPGDKRNRVLARSSRMPLAVAILGSRALDVADVDLDTLRLGAGEAAPNRPDLASGPSFPSPLPIRVTPAAMPVNRDRFDDLLAFYPLQDAGIAYGDRELCLVAKTRDGELLEGCDRIDTTVPSAR